MDQLQNHDCRTELRQVSLRVTTARLGVLAALEQTEKPLDVFSVLDSLKKQHIKADKATVFRIINILSLKGVIIPIQLGEGKFRYEHSAKSDHHHFICDTCGEIADVTSCIVKKWEKALKIERGFEVKRHSLEFFGLCVTCQNKKNEK